MSTINATAVVYYLEHCPFSDKDQVKSLGAKWDASAKKWFVPSNLYATIEQFNPWRPNNKVFLNCPFNEKEDVKKAGAKWDAHVKRWFISSDTSSAKFSKWLQVSSAAETTAPTTATASPAPAVTKPRGNAQDATLLRINENMTIPQLQTECRCRGIKGLSGKNKDWLLEQLGIGTVWQSFGQQATDRKSTTTILSQSSSVSSSTITAKKKDQPLKKPATNKESTAGKSKEPKKKPTLNKEFSAVKATTAPSTPAAPTTIDWSRLPRISSNLTMVQLSHELLHRHPNVKGTSNKPKSWILEQLGDGSVWTTSPTTVQEYGHFLSQMPRVSASLTTVQLMHELLSRQLPADYSKGLSRKNKSELLNLVGVGSIWTTAATGAMVASATAAAPPPLPPPAETKTTTTPKTAKVATKEAAAKPKALMTAAKLAQKSSISSSSSKKSNVATAVAGTIATTTTTTRAKKETTKGKVLVATKCARKSSTTISSSKQTTIPTTMIQQSPQQPEAVSSAKLPKKEYAAKESKMPAKKPPPVYPPPTASSSSANNAAAVFASSCGLKPSPKATTKKQPTTTQPAPVAAAAAPEKVQSKTAPTQKKQPATAKIEPAAKRVKLEKAVDDAIPVVSSTMTVSQLKDEMKARDPNAKGLTGKSKEFLLSRLGIGTELHGSAEYMATQDLKAQQLHIYQSRCHDHPLADSSILRRGLNSTVGKRIDSARCDVQCNMWICRTTAFRTCERCNWDICKPCFEVASLGSKQDQEREIQSRLDKMAEQEAQVQRDWERRQAEELDRHERWEQQYKRDREMRMQELFGDKMKKFPPNIRKPSDVNRDADNKLSYTVWTRDVHRKQTESDVGREFDSSFATLKEANLRVEYVFHFGDDRSEDGLYVNVDKELPGGLRYLRNEPDGGGSLTVSAFPSEVFDNLLASDGDDDDFRGNPYSASFHRDDHDDRKQSPRKESKYPKNIRNPGAANKNESKKLKFSVWTSCGYDYDGWHSYEGPPEKEFNASYDTIEEANARVEYVFYYENPWGLSVDGYEFPHVETDVVSPKTGFRRLECCSDDSERWTVSAVPSIMFDYINV